MSSGTSGMDMAAQTPRSSTADTLRGYTRNRRANQTLVAGLEETILEAARKLDWQELCLKGLKLADIDTIAVLTQHLVQAQRELEKLQESVRYDKQRNEQPMREQIAMQQAELDRVSKTSAQKAIWPMAPQVQPDTFKNWGMEIQKGLGKASEKAFTSKGKGEKENGNRKIDR